MNLATCPEGSANALGCAGNGASRPARCRKFAESVNPGCSKGFAVSTKGRGTEWRAQAKHADLYRWQSAFTIAFGSFSKQSPEYRFGKKRIYFRDATLEQFNLSKHGSTMTNGECSLLCSET